METSSIYNWAIHRILVLDLQQVSWWLFMQYMQPLIVSESSTKALLQLQIRSDHILKVVGRQHNKQ